MCYFSLFTFGIQYPFVVFLHRKRGTVLRALRLPTYDCAGHALEKGIWPWRVNGAETQSTLLQCGWPGRQRPGGRDALCRIFSISRSTPYNLSSSVLWMTGLHELHPSLPTSGLFPPVGVAGRRTNGRDFVSLGTPCPQLQGGRPLFLSAFIEGHSSHSCSSCWVLSI